MLLGASIEITVLFESLRKFLKLLNFNVILGTYNLSKNICYGVEANWLVLTF